MASRTASSFASKSWDILSELSRSAEGRRREREDGNDRRRRAREEVEVLVNGMLLLE